MTVEEKALALVNGIAVAERKLPSYLVCDRRNDSRWEALCRAIEAREADKKAFSDAMRIVQEHLSGPKKTCLSITIADGRKVQFADFILPEPDPLAEARRQIADRVLRQYGAPASDEDCIGLIVAALEEQAKIERIEQ